MTLLHEGSLDIYHYWFLFVGAWGLFRPCCVGHVVWAIFFCSVHMSRLETGGGDIDALLWLRSAGILVDNIAPSVYRCCEQGIDMLCDYEQNVDNAVRAAKTASAVVVILSPGCLQSPLHLHIICSLMRSHTREAIISVHTPGFEFPPPPAIKELCASYPILDEGHNHLAADCMIAFFKRIS